MTEEHLFHSDKKASNDRPPRTRHLNPDGSPRFTNRLAGETSPYLLQHSHNPVDWFPWGNEAFAEAEKQKKPLFVSIGYSTCHWCHVMEEESFEDLEIAEFINTHFIPVKVDREDRPDIDSIYMAAIQILNGNGGWPLNVFLTKRGEPIYGGTYFPPRDGDRGAFTGFLTLLENISRACSERPDMIRKSADQLVNLIRNSLSPAPGSHIPPEQTTSNGIGVFRKIYDPVNGGVTGSPKFPSSLPVRLFLDVFRKTGDTSLLGMATHTLTKMARGGMYDQIGGGFHRYSTDSAWLVPHFEKMLYDNALLVMAYLDGFQITANNEFRHIAEETLDYIMREMTTDEGAFYAASDADSPDASGKKEEGWYFTWEKAELESLLGKEDMALFSRYYSIGDTPDFEGRHIPHITESPSAIADTLGITPDDLIRRIGSLKTILYREREKREKPHIDTKIITGWNGLMISAFARAGRILEDGSRIATARKAAEFILNNLSTGDRLFRSFRDHKPSREAFLDDYTFFQAGLIDLYEADGDTRWLRKAKELDVILEKLFEDSESGGFYMTPSDHEPLIAREKPFHDGAIPSGNSVAVMNLLRFFNLTGEKPYLERAEKALTAVSDQLEKHPAAFGEMILALYHYHGMIELS